MLWKPKRGEGLRFEGGGIQQTVEETTNGKEINLYTSTAKHILDGKCKTSFMHLPHFYEKNLILLNNSAVQKCFYLLFLLVGGGARGGKGRGGGFMQPTYCNHFHFLG